MLEANKDEALRAKDLAEKKMLSNDFVGALKVALKAERLYPQLENISQLLTVCNVHCSAQINTVGSEKDWYGILQIDAKADDVTIRKQYRRLALVLHPDKNKFPGAEAAFKLIGEANMVLSDSTKRAVYDSKRRAFPKGTAPHQVNRNSSVRNNNIPNGVSTHFGNLNNHKQTQPTSSAFSGTFWTVCPFCNIKYQYYRTFANRALRCQKCSKPFIAYDLGSQGVPPGPKWSHTGGQDVPLRPNTSQPCQQKEVPNQGTSKMAGEGVGFTPVQVASQKGPNSRTMRSQPEVPREKTAHDKEMGGVKGGVAMPKVDNKSRKRSRKQTVESSESIEQTVESSESIATSTSTEPEAEDIDSCSYQPTGETRRSSRLRQRVSYNEGASDDENDLASSPKKVRANQSAGDDTCLQKEAVSGDDVKHAASTSFRADSNSKAAQNGTASPKANMADKKVYIGKVDKQAAGQSSGVEKVEVVDSDSEPDPDASDDPPTVYECPDPEFNDFDKHKEASCFAVGDIWSCYDTADGMPRFYCQIRKVLTPKFELRFNWLEAEAEAANQGDREWVEAELPIGCGKFKRGEPDTTADRLSFSHQMQCEKGKRGQFIVYPRRGEIWALFKDWDISWSFDPENHRTYKYQIVEILSDIVEDGIKVSYLDKVSGFVSLFQSTSQTKFGPFFVKPNELRKFSHRIPSFKMTGTEKKGVPVGSFELDPAALPLDPDDIWYPGKVNVTTPKKSVDSKGKGAVHGESSKVRRSPRGVNIHMTNKL